MHYQGHSESACISALRCVWYSIERQFMSKRIQHIVVGLLLTSYIFVGAVARLEGFGSLFCFDDGPHKVEQGRPALPPPPTVSWTQYKHIPSFTEGTSLSLAILTHTEWPQLQQFARLSDPEDILTCQFSVSIRLLSRAPPLFTTAS